MRTILLFIIVSSCIIPESKNLVFANADIYNKYFPDSDTVHLGVARIPDTLNTIFIVKNSNSKLLRIGPGAPSYFFGASLNPEHNKDWQEFHTTVIPTVSYDIKSDSNFIIDAFFAADTNLIIYPPGKKELRMILGLYDPETMPNPQSAKDLIVCDSFIVWAFKTMHYADGYDNLLIFDSTYTKSVVNNKKWIVQSTYNKSLVINSWNLTPLTVTPEFYVNAPQMPLNVPSGSITEFDIDYKPLNRGIDSAMISFDYSPKPANLPSNYPLPSVKLIGCGVEQQLILTGENVEIDTLTFDDTKRIGIRLDSVRVGDSTEIIATLFNNGNLPFGALSQRVVNYYNSNDAPGFKLVKNILVDGYHLQPSYKDTFRIIFKPQYPGRFDARYIIESDIIHRKIFGVPNYAKRIEIFIQGYGIEPQLYLDNDTIDMGYVFVGCPPKRDTVINLYNRGNETLNVTFLPSLRYQVEPNELSIPPYSKSTATISLTLNELGTFIDSINILTNETSPNDRRTLFIKAIGLPLLEADISVPDLAIKPGTPISIPILIDDTLVTFASNFKAILSYNPTLMRFDDMVFNGTASEGADLYSNASESRNGNLIINIYMPENQYFRQSDTLVLIRFRTYLGDRISTPVIIMNPRFGDKICTEVFAINPDKNINNGSITLDSICGLNQKAFSRNGKRFIINDVYPNPVDNYLNIDFQVPVKSDVSIILYDSYGNISVRILSDNISEGRYIANYDISNLTPGAYLCKFTAGLFSDSKIIIITNSR